MQLNTDISDLFDSMSRQERLEIENHFGLDAEFYGIVGSPGYYAVFTCDADYAGQSPFTMTEVFGLHRSATTGRLVVSDFDANPEEAFEARQRLAELNS